MRVEISGDRDRIVLQDDDITLWEFADRRIPAAYESAKKGIFARLN